MREKENEVKKREKKTREIKCGGNWRIDDGDEKLWWRAKRGRTTISVWLEEGNIQG